MLEYPTQIKSSFCSPIDRFFKIVILDVSEDSLEHEVCMINRKLFRPSLSELRDQGSPKSVDGQKRRVPPDQTNAEQYYYLKQMTNRTPMIVHLIDGEKIRGIIEWYDRACIKVNRNLEPNLLIPKHTIKYIYKQTEDKKDLGDLENKTKC